MLMSRTCPLCGRAGPAPCGSCVRQLDRAPALPPPPGVDDCVALLAYEEAAALFPRAQSPLPRPRSARFPNGSRGNIISRTPLLGA